MEIDVVQRHACSVQASREVRSADMNTLLFKPFYLIKRIVDIMNETGINDNNGVMAIRIVLSEHFSKLSENYNNAGYLESREMLELIPSDKWIDYLVHDTKGQRMELMPDSVFTADNRFLTDSFRQMLDGNLPDKLAAFMREETGANGDLFDVKWDVFSLVYKALNTDVAIEYGKIRMIDFSGR